MGNTCGNACACDGDAGENGEILTVDNKYGMQKFNPDLIDHYLRNLDLVIRLQAWARGVVTRERIRA